MDKSHVHIIISAEVKEKAVDYANKELRTLSSLVEIALKEKLEKEHKQNKN